MRLLLLTGCSQVMRASVTRRTLAPAFSVAHDTPIPHGKFANGVLIGGGVSPFHKGVQADVLAWLRRAEPESVLTYERALANDLFCQVAERIGYEVTVAHLDMYSIIEDSQDSAALALKWCRGWWLGGLDPMDVWVARLREHPVVKAIREVRSAQAGV